MYIVIIFYSIFYSIMCTEYIQIFKECNFQGFHGELAIRKIFTLEISLVNFELHESESRILGDPRK